MDTDTITTWQAELDAHGSVTFGAPRHRQGLLTAAAVALIVFGILLAFTRSIEVLRVGVCVAAGVGALFLPGALRHLLVGRPIVIVDGSGIASGRQWVSWSEVTDIEAWDYVDSRIVILDIVPSAARRLRANLNPVQRHVESPIQRRLADQSMCLPIISAFDADEMCAWLNQLLLAHQSS